MEKTGLNRRQLADWFTKARQKLKEEGSLFKDICRIKDVKLIVNSSFANKKQKVSDSDPSVSVDLKQSDVGLSDHAKSYLERWYQVQPTSDEVDNYLYKWMSRPSNLNNFAPKQHERTVMEKESGIEDRRIESWFYRLGKRWKKQAEKEGLTLEELMRGLGGVLKKEREERLGSRSRDRRWYYHWRFG